MGWWGLLVQLQHGRLWDWQQGGPLQLLVQLLLVGFGRQGAAVQSGLCLLHHLPWYHDRSLGVFNVKGVIHCQELNLSPPQHFQMHCFTLTFPWQFLAPSLFLCSRGSSWKLSSAFSLSVLQLSLVLCCWAVKLGAGAQLG